MLLVTLGILTHIRFLRAFVPEYLIYCWLVWTKRATNWFVEIGYSLVCPVLDYDSLMCNWCRLKFMTLCLNLIMFFFCLKSHSAFCSLSLAHGFNIWSGAIYLLTKVFRSLLLRVLHLFLLLLFYLFHIPFPTRCSNPRLCIWVRIGEWRKCQ